MKVILTQKVQHLGSVGEIVNVTAGYARNFLIPKSYAVLADEKNKKALENQKKKLTKIIEAEKKAAEEVAKKIKGITLEFTKRITGSGTLFGTITTNDIAKVLNEKELAVEKRQIVIETAIKTLGTFEATAQLFKDVEAKFNIKVVIDPKQAEEIKKREEAALKKKKDAAAKKEAAAEAGEEADAEKAEGEEEAKTEESAE
jgi:large subunit ribosomal protein L9